MSRKAENPVNNAEVFFLLWTTLRIQVVRLMLASLLGLGLYRLIAHR